MTAFYTRHEYTDKDPTAETHRPRSSFFHSGVGNVSVLRCLFAPTLKVTVPFMFGLLCGSEELLYVLGYLLRLADDVLRARQGGVFLACLLLLPCF